MSMRENLCKGHLKELTFVIWYESWCTLPMILPGFHVLQVVVRI